MTKKLLQVVSDFEPAGAQPEAINNLVSGLEDRTIYFPPIERCTDNGAMIAYAGSFHLNTRKFDKSLEIKPRWPLSELKHG